MALARVLDLGAYRERRWDIELREAEYEELNIWQDRWIAEVWQQDEHPSLSEVTEALREMRHERYRSAW